MQGLVTSNIRTTCVALASLLSLLASTGGVFAHTAEQGSEYLFGTGSDNPSTCGSGSRGNAGAFAGEA